MTGQEIATQDHHSSNDLAASDMFDPEQGEPMTDTEVVDLINGMADLAKANPDNPVVLMAGRFAMYPMPDGGIMFVTDCSQGLMAMAGVKRTRVPPAMLRAVAVLSGGGSRAQALKAALFGGRRRGAIGNGR